MSSQPGGFGSLRAGWIGKRGVASLFCARLFSSLEEPGMMTCGMRHRLSASAVDPRWHSPHSPVPPPHLTLCVCSPPPPPSPFDRGFTKFVPLFALGRFITQNSHAANPHPLRPVCLGSLRPRSKNRLPAAGNRGDDEGGGVVRDGGLVATTTPSVCVWCVKPGQDYSTPEGCRTTVVPPRGAAAIRNTY